MISVNHQQFLVNSRFQTKTIPERWKEKGCLGLYYVRKNLEQN